MLTVVDIRRTQSGDVVDVKDGGILPYSIPFATFKHLPGSLDALVEYALTDPEHDAFYLSEPPTPEAEQQAAEIARDAHWLADVSEPTVYDLAVNAAEYNLKRAHETGIDIEWAERRLQEEIEKATRVK